MTASAGGPRRRRCGLLQAASLAALLVALYHVRAWGGAPLLGAPAAPQARPAAVAAAPARAVVEHGGPRFWFIWSVASLDTWHWMPLACVEAVVAFHPTARVVVLSNSMPLDHFACLARLGFDVRVERYDIAALVRGGPLEDFVERGAWAAAANSTFRYAHE